MTIDAWPSALSSGMVVPQLEGGGRSGGGAAGGLPAATGASTSGPHWTAQVSELPLLSGEEISAARALEGRLDGGASPVLINICTSGISPQVQGGATIAAELGDNAAAGGDAIVISFTGGDHHPLRGGEFLNLVHDEPAGRRLYMITEILGGTVNQPLVRITPQLRADALTGATVHFRDLVCPMRLADGFEMMVDLGRFSAIEAGFTEWFEDGNVIQPSAGAFPVRFMRVRSLHTHDGDVYFSPASFALYDEFDGTALVGDRISSSLYNGTDLDTAFDGSSITGPDLDGAGGWIGFRFATPTARPKEIFLGSQFETKYEQMPSEFVYEEGVADPADPDNPEAAAWTIVKTFPAAPHWYGDEGRYYAIASTAALTWEADDTWRKQRIRCLQAQGGGNTFGLHTFKLRATSGGATASENLVGWIVGAGALFNLEDGLFGTICEVLISAPAVGGWFGKDAGKTPIARYEEVYMASEFFNAAIAPRTFVLEGTNFAGDWVELKRRTNEPTWAGDEGRTYDLRPS